MYITCFRWYPVLESQRTNSFSPQRVHFDGRRCRRNSAFECHDTFVDWRTATSCVERLIQGINNIQHRLDFEQWIVVRWASFCLISLLLKCRNDESNCNVNPVMMMAMTTRYTVCVFLFNSVWTLSSSDCWIVRFFVATFGFIIMYVSMAINARHRTVEAIKARV